jgi:hypothetical protein
MMLRRARSTEKGAGLLVAIVVLLVLAVMAATMASLVSTGSDTALYQFRSGEALYILQAGAEYALKMVYPNYYTPSLSLGSGSFSITPPTILTGAMTDTSTANITVGSTTGFPSSGRILIDSELISYAFTSATSFDNITRAAGRSAAAAHAVNTGVYPATTLTATVSSAAATIPVSNTTGFRIPGTIKVDQEYLYCTGTVGGFSGCTRGTYGSVAATHVSGSTVIQTNITITATVPTGITTPDTRRVLIAEAGLYEDGFAVGNPSALPTQDLNSVVCVSAGDCWAVGNAGTILRYNGIVWSAFTSPVTQELNEVRCASAADCWAVGVLNGTQPTMIRWNNDCDGNPANTGAWTNCTAAAPATNEDLNSVHMISATDGWAVGDRNGTRPTAMRWNNDCDGVPSGTNAWTNCTIAPYVPAINEHLYSVYMVSATDGWAVGDQDGTQPIVFRWDTPCVGGGGTGVWNDCTNLPNFVPNINEDLNSVFMVSATDGFAVGDTDGTEPTIFRWNTLCGGGAVPPAWDDCSNTTPNVNENLWSVYVLDTDADGDADDGWAVGNSNGTRPVAFRWNIPCAGGGGNNNWNDCTSAAFVPAVNEDLFGVHCVAANDCWAVGTSGLILHWNGTVWSALPAAAPVMLRWNGMNWDSVAAPAGITQNLNSVWALDADVNGLSEDGWAVGNSNGTRAVMLRWNTPCAGGAGTGVWNDCTSAAFVPAINQNMNSVSMMSAADGFAVGNRRGCINPGPTIFRWNGAAWSCPAGLPAADQNLNSVFMRSAADGWTVGNTNGTRPAVLRWNTPCGGGAGTNNWNNCTNATFVPAINQPLNSVHMVSATDGFAVGNRIGAATNQWMFLRWNSPVPNFWNQNVPITGVSAQHLLSVFMLDTDSDGDADDGFAVGNRRGCINPGPTILRWSGAAWACPAGLPAAADQNLNTVYCASSTDCWASGNTGLLLHWNGTAWSVISPLTNNQINELFLLGPQPFLRLPDWQEVY